MSMIHGYLNGVPDDFGHRWTNALSKKDIENIYKQKTN